MWLLLMLCSCTWKSSASHERSCPSGLGRRGVWASSRRRQRAGAAVLHSERVSVPPPPNRRARPVPAARSADPAGASAFGFCFLFKLYLHGSVHISAAPESVEDPFLDTLDQSQSINEEEGLRCALKPCWCLRLKLLLAGI